MNNLLLKLKISAILIVLIILNGSVYSQTIISSVNVSNNATLISKQFTENKTGSIILEKEPGNWLSNKNYLDFSSSSFNFHIMMAMKEEVYENNEIENWMLDVDFWKINTDFEENPIEDWMTNDKFWVVVN